MGYCYDKIRYKICKLNKIEVMVQQSSSFLAKKQTNSPSRLIIEVMMIPHIKVKNPAKLISDNSRKKKRYKNFFFQALLERIIS